MRIAFATNPALGHLLPLVPLAQAARDAGHDVVVVGGASVARPVRRRRARPMSSAGRPDLASVFARVPERAGLTRPTPGRGHRGSGRSPAILAEAMAPRSWTSRPYVAAGPRGARGQRAGLVDRGGARWAIPYDRAPGDGLARDPVPAVRGAAQPAAGAPRAAGGPGAGAVEPLRVPHDPPAGAARRRTTRCRPGTRPIRPTRTRRRGRRIAVVAPDREPGGPRVVVTMGTILPGATRGDGGDPRRARARSTCDIVATVGHDLDPADLGPRRPSTRVARYVPVTRAPRRGVAAGLPRGLGDDAGGPRRGRAAGDAAGRRGPARERRPVRRRRASPACWPSTRAARATSRRGGRDVLAEPSYPAPPRADPRRDRRDAGAACRAARARGPRGRRGPATPASIAAAPATGAGPARTGSRAGARRGTRAPSRTTGARSAA